MENYTSLAKIARMAGTTRERVLDIAQDIELDLFHDGKTGAWYMVNGRDADIMIEHLNEMRD